MGYEVARFSNTRRTIVLKKLNGVYSISVREGSSIRTYMTGRAREDFALVQEAFARLVDEEVRYVNQSEKM